MDSNINKRKSKNLKKKAFTLVELIIVLAVMAIIAAVAIPNFARVKNNAAIKADEQSAKAIERSVKVLMVDDTINYKEADVEFTITFKDGSPIIDNSFVGSGKLLESLEGINAPQASENDYYDVKITKDGNVTVKAGPSES